MPNALIYSPDFDGHRQVYVFVLSHILIKKGFKIHIAGNTKQNLLNSFYLDQLRKNPEISFIDTSMYNEGGLKITLLEFLSLQNQCSSDLTFFAEADNHISLFVSQIRKDNRLRGRLAGIFLRPFYYYEKTSIREKLRHIKHLPVRWKDDVMLFHEFFLTRFHLLDAAVYLDENFVDHHKYSYWMPDVFQEYADAIVKDRKSEQRSWIYKLEDFKAKNKGRFMFLYFGTSQYRRGYDTLLKLAAKNDGCFIHCGLNIGSDKYVLDIDEFRSLLNREGRLFETNQYIEDPFCIEYFFKSISHMVLPYRNFYGSSGVMLQALSFGIPVLAPENGIIGYRIKKFQLGSIYNETKGPSLDKEFDKFIKLDPATFKENIRDYMNYQSVEKLEKTLMEIADLCDKTTIEKS